MDVRRSVGGFAARSVVAVSLVELSAVRLCGGGAYSIADDDGLTHRSFDSEAILDKGAYTRFVPCKRVWVYRPSFVEIADVPTCLWCLQFVSTV